MKVVVIYRPSSEHARQIEQFVADYQRVHPDGRLEILNLDTREGDAAATLYDIVNYPAILVTREDGSVLNTWVGTELPLMDEIAGYAYA